MTPWIFYTGIGLTSGDIILHNIKYDETVMKYTQDWGPVTGELWCMHVSRLPENSSDVGNDFCAQIFSFT